MSGDNRIGTNAVGGVARIASARRAGTDDSSVSRAAAAYAAPLTGDSNPIASLTSTARAIADQGPPVDMDRIGALRSAIADGSYQLDAQQTASAMMGFFGRNG